MSIVKYEHLQPLQRFSPFSYLQLASYRISDPQSLTPPPYIANEGSQRSVLRFESVLRLSALAASVPPYPLSLLVSTRVNDVIAPIPIPIPIQRCLNAPNP